MLSFRQIGLISCKHYVYYQFLSTRSTSVVMRQKKKLKTSGETSAKKKQKINLEEAELACTDMYKEDSRLLFVQGRQLQAGLVNF